MAIYPDAIWVPSPNFGYSRGTHGQLPNNIRRTGRSGEFWHSMVGSLSAAKWRFLNPEAGASAHFLFPRLGRPTQMVDSSDAAWHSGNYLSNLHFHGFEFEGGAPGNYSEPLTESQIAWGIKATRWLREAHNSPKIYVRRETLWEHNEVAATSCPSGRIPWARLITELEDDMGLTTEDKEFILDQTRYLETRQNQHADVRKDEHAALVAKMDALQAKVDALEAGDGTAYTDEEAVKAVKAAL